MLKVNFNSEPICGDNDKYIKTKIKIYGGSVNTNFQGKKKSKEKVPCNSLSKIMLDSVVKAKKKYYPQILLEECKFDGGLEKSSSDDSDNEDENDETKPDNDNDESNE